MRAGEHGVVRAGQALQNMPGSQSPFVQVSSASGAVTLAKCRNEPPTVFTGTKNETRIFYTNGVGTL